ncbi:hypothetical protein FACS1894216_10090 [Synergistales bacterium]|nr:hypothetical protein FACS1894216_10090 [Synergistales bacterium]
MKNSIRLFIAALVFLWLGSADAAQKFDFSGKWRRTDISMAYEANITIKQSGSHFDFKFEGQSGANTGEIEGRAAVTGNGRAIFKVPQEADTADPATVEFILSGKLLKVTVKDGDAFTLGFGAGVYMDGDYTKGKPVYTNTNIAEEILPTPKIKDSVLKLLGKSAFDGMIGVMQYGVDYGDADFTYSGFIPGAGQGVDLLIKDGRIYCLGYNLDENDKDYWGYTFYTNDPAWAKALPPFMDPHRKEEQPVKFVFKK